MDLIDVALSVSILRIVSTSSLLGYEKMFGEALGEAVTVGFVVGVSVGRTVLEKSENR